MTDPAVFPVPYAAEDRPSWSSIARAMRVNALAGFSRRAFEEEVVSRQFLGRQQIVLSRPEAIRHILVDNSSNYRRTVAVFRLLGPIIGRGGLFLADGDTWKEQRHALAPAFAPRTLPVLAAHVARAADALVARLEAGTGEVDLLAEMQHLALEIAGTSMFSLEFQQYGPQMRARIRQYAEWLGRPVLLDFLLPLGIPTPRDLARAVFRHRWMRLIRQIVATRRAQPPGAAPRDLLDLLSSVCGSERALVDQVATMIVAGHETTGVALFWSLYLLASVPEVQDRVAAEVAEIDLGPDAASAALPRLPYTRAVIQETLRLFPPAFSIVRQARADDVADGVPIPAHAIVLMVPWILHRHRLLWADPDRFDPTRFLPGATPPDRFAYLPFGAGQRVCIGAQFALTEAVLVLARLIQAFHIERASDEPVLPAAVITLQPDHAAPFRLRSRAPGVGGLRKRFPDAAE